MDGVNFNGITIGTHARKVISSYQAKPSTINNEILQEAIESAKNLIGINLYGKSSNKQTR